MGYHVMAYLAIMIVIILMAGVISIMMMLLASREKSDKNGCLNIIMVKVMYLSLLSSCLLEVNVIQLPSHLLQLLI